MWCLDFLFTILFPPSTADRHLHTLTFEKLHEEYRTRVIITHELLITTLFDYRSPNIRLLIQQAKFEGNRRAQELLGSMLATFLASERFITLEFSNKIVLVPLPLSRARKRARGYNQVERIARYAQQHLPISFQVNTALLRRVRDTAPQTTLGRAARFHNVQDAFAVSAALDPTFIYVLIDDVVTTGATVYAAHEALRAGGALHLYIVALAH
jgi:ComF family protein